MSGVHLTDSKLSSFPFVVVVAIVVLLSHVILFS